MTSLLGSLVPNLLGAARRIGVSVLGAGSSPTLALPNSIVPVRTKIRNYFPRAKETVRVNVHGWKVRMSTRGGRRVIMNRILKGKHILSH